MRTFDLDHLDVFWELETGDESIERLNFFLLRSVDGPAGPFLEHAGPFRNQFLFRDADVHLLHKWRAYFYKLKIVDPDSGEALEFGPVQLEAEPDRIALEIQRRQQLALQEFNGRRVVLFPALTFGQRCRNCWDSGKKGNTIGRSKQQQCASCLDSTFVGGYASPMIVFMQIDTAAAGVQRTDVGDRSTVDSSARLAAFPPVKARDMIVEEGNRRWEVQSVVSTEKLRATLHQELRIHLIPPSDVRYKVPVRLDVKTEHSPAREFSRLMSLQTPPLEVVADLLGPR